MRLSTTDQMIIYKRMAYVSRVGVPLADCMKMLCEEGSNRGVGRVLVHIERSLREGHTCSYALRTVEGVSPDTITIIETGERSGTLTNALLMVVTILDTQMRMKRAIRSAFIYPTIIILITIGITVFLTVYLFPKLTPIFLSMHTELPFSTRVVLSVSHVLVHDWLAVVCAMACFVLVIRIVWNRKIMNDVRSRVVLYIPIVRSLVVAHEVGRSMRIVSVLLNTDMSLCAVFQTVAHSSRVALYRALFVRCAETVQRGGRASDVFRTSPRLMPPIAVHMIATGEMSASLVEHTRSIAEEYERAVIDMTKDITTLIEPILMITMGLVVGFIALAIIAPIYQLTQVMHL